MQGVAGLVGGKSTILIYNKDCVHTTRRFTKPHLHFSKCLLQSQSQSQFLRYRKLMGLRLIQDSFRIEASNADIGTGRYEENDGNNPQEQFSVDQSQIDNVSLFEKQTGRVHFIRSVAGVMVIGTAVAAVVTLVRGGPSALMATISKSGFTAAFSLISVSEIGDKTFFIAALLAMQYTKWMVLLGSMGALSLMTVISVVIGRIFHTVPEQFQTTLPIGEYAAVALLLFFGFTSIKNAWDLPSQSLKSGGSGHELGELVEAEELVKEKVSDKLSTPVEIIWKSFSLVFFAEWGDRSMLATIALGAAQSPLGVATGAIAGHAAATSVAVLGGAFLARYISEKMVGYMSGALFLLFAVATLLGAF